VEWSHQLMAWKLRSSSTSPGQDIFDKFILWLHA
jgi:hypothetical protein